MENSVIQPNKKLQKVADMLRKALDERRDIIRGFGKGQLSNFYENYFPHIWKHPERASMVIADILRKHPIEGAKSFLKKRIHMTTKAGLEAGLEPLSWNPVELALMKIHEMDRYIFAQELIKDMKGRGLLKFRYSKSKMPKGYVEIKDHAFTVYAPPEITIEEAHDKMLVDQLMSLAASLGVNTQRVMKMRGNTWGEAHGDKMVRTRFGGPESVWIHEIGHILGERYDLFEWLTRPDDKGYERTVRRGKNRGTKKLVESRSAKERRKLIKEELRALADKRFEGQEESTSQYFKNYVRKQEEKEAVILEAYIHAPKQMESVAPTVKAEFEKFLNEHTELRPLLDIQPSLTMDTNKGTISIPGFVTLGYWVAEEPVGRLLNNHLSPGLSGIGNRTGSNMYHAFRKFSNAINQSTLSLSGFHAFNVITDTLGSYNAMANREMYTKGQRSKGLKKKIALIGTAGIGSPVHVLYKGRKLIKAYRQQIDKIQDPRMREMVETFIMAGGSAKMDAFYFNNAVRGLQKSIGQIVKGELGEKVAGTLKLPTNVILAALELTAKPTMEWLVPHLKVGVWALMAEHELKRNEDGQTTDDQMWEMISRNWDSVENRMGQLTYDNLFWNKLTKDIAMLGVRSVGWNLGYFREYPGAVLDIVMTPSRLKAGDKLVSQKMGYVWSNWWIYAIIGAIITYLFTGDRPKKLKDLFFPPTGHTNPDGSDERLKLPTYAGDTYGYATSPLKTLKHKAHPAIGVVADVVTNEDYWGNEIFDKSNPLNRIAMDVSKYVGTSFLPFSVRSYERYREAGEKESIAAVTAISGITSAPAHVSRTPAHALMVETLSGYRPREKGKREDFENAIQRKKIITMIREGKEVPPEYESKYSSQQWRNMYADAAMSPKAASFKKLHLDDALNVYNLANAEERREWKPLLQVKYKNSRSVTEDIELYFNELMKLD